MRLHRLLLRPCIRINMIILRLPVSCVKLISRDLLIMTILPGTGTPGITIIMRIIGRSLKEGMPVIFTAVGLTMVAFARGIMVAVGHPSDMGGVVMPIAGM